MSDRVSPLSVIATLTGLRVSGELDASSAQMLAECLYASSADAGDTELLMSEVSFIDSSGLQVLIDAHHAAVNRGCRLVIAEPSPTVTRLLSISGLTSYLHVRPAS